MASKAQVDFLMADLDMPVMRGEEMAGQDQGAAAGPACALCHGAQRSVVSRAAGTSTAKRS